MDSSKGSRQTSRRFVIHSSNTIGYAFPGALAAVGVFGAINAFLIRIWANPGSLIIWLIIVGGAVVVILVAEALYRRSHRNVLAVSDYRVRWSFRQPQSSGDEPLSSLQEVNLYPSDAQLVFKEGFVIVSGVDFRLPDIKRLVDALGRLGVTINDMRVGR